MNIRIAALAAMTTMMTGAAFAAPSSPLFYGYESYNTQERLGWYSLAADGTTGYLWTDKSGSTGIPMTAGWRRDNKLCGISSLLAEGKLYALNYIELDEATGEVILSQGIEAATDNYLNYYITAAYNSTDDHVYGYGYSADGQTMVFKKSSFDITDTEVIKVIGSGETCASLTYNEETGSFIGFNRKSFVSINPATGEQTEIFTPVLSDYQYTVTALSYDPESGLYYWNMVSNNRKSHLYKIDLSQKTCELVCDYNDLSIFSFLVPANPNGDPTAPTKPEFASSGFTGGALEGTVTFKMPTTLINGDRINGNMTWTATVDGNEVANGTASPGTEITFQSGKLTEGMHAFGVRVALGEKTSRQGIWNAFIGNDTPAAPASISLKGTSLTWDAVEIGANGGYVNPSEITYSVYLNGTLQGTTSDTSYTITYPENRPYTSYQASVTAAFSGKTSEAGMSNTVKYGNPVSLPIDLAPSATEAELFESIDALGGSQVWTYDGSSSGRENFTSPLSDGNAVDSWLFMPPVATDAADGVYEFSIRLALSSAEMNEGTIEVMAGTAPEPEAMTSTIITPLALSQTSLKEFKGLFTPAALGNTDKVYIGVRARSESGNYRVYGRRYIVKATDMNATVADAPVVESVEALPEGELKARVSFTLPTKRMNGEAIPSSEKVQAIVQCDINNATVEGAPGSKAIAEVLTNQGENYITVTSSLNGVKGNYGRTRVFTGEAIPGPIRNLKIEIPADNQSCVLSWDAPNEALSEGYLNPEQVKYYYCTYNSTNGTYTPDTNLGEERSYTVMAPAPNRLTNINFAIQTRTDAGSSPEYEGTRIQLGKPYTLAMAEIFYDPEKNKAAMNYSPYTLVTSGNYQGTSWQLTDPKEINAAYEREIPVALIGSGQAGSTGYLQLPKFSTEGCDKAGIEIGIYGEATTPTLEIWGYSTDQADPVAIGSITKYDNGQYARYGFQFPESLQNQGWVTLFFTPQYEVNGNLVISDYLIDRTLGITLPSAEARKLSAEAGKGWLRISGCEAAEVYTIDGRKVWSDTIEGEKTLSLSPAIYIVVSGNESLRTIVK